MELRNEFAKIRIEADNTANGPRLMILDLKSGRRSFFDPLELESLTWARHEELTPLLDPANRIEV